MNEKSKSGDITKRTRSRKEESLLEQEPKDVESTRYFLPPFHHLKTSTARNQIPEDHQACCALHMSIPGTQP